MDGLPDSAFGMGPNTRHHVIQEGYGGDFVIRSNPIGAVLDTIRGFCSPVPLMDDGNGGYDNLSDGNLDYIPASGGGQPTGYSWLPQGGTQPGTGGPGPVIPPDPGATCGMGTIYDATSMTCVPKPKTGGPDPVVMPPAQMDPCGFSNLQASMQAFNAAKTACDVAGVQMVAGNAAVCAKQKGALKAQWTNLAKAAMTAAKSMQRTCGDCSNPMRVTLEQKANAAYRMKDQMMLETLVTTAAGCVGRTMGDFRKQWTGTYNKIRKQSMMLSMQKPPKMMMVPAKSAPAMPAGKKLPNTPSHLSTTEGNVRMMASREPLDGAFDPRKAAQHNNISNLFGW